MPSLIPYRARLARRARRRRSHRWSRWAATAVYSPQKRLVRGAKPWPDGRLPHGLPLASCATSAAYCGASAHRARSVREVLVLEARRESCDRPTEVRCMGPTHAAAGCSRDCAATAHVPTECLASERTGRSGAWPTPSLLPAAGSSCRSGTRTALRCDATPLMPIRRYTDGIRLVRGVSRVNF